MQQKHQNGARSALQRHRFGDSDRIFQRIRTRITTDTYYWALCDWYWRLEEKYCLWLLWEGWWGHKVVLGACGGVWSGRLQEFVALCNRIDKDTRYGLQQTSEQLRPYKKIHNKKSSLWWDQSLSKKLHML